MSINKTIIAPATVRPGSAPCKDPGDLARFFLCDNRCLYQPPTCHKTKAPSKAAIENQARLERPRGMIIQAASNGPVAVPVFPPTWKIDCARPYRPPEAIRATREDS